MRAADELRAAAAALTFETRVPLGRWIDVDGEDVARSGVVFPLVGAGIGAAVGAIAYALADPLSPLLAAAIALGAGVILTGALHLDALADTADALGARTRERALEIMRDHTIGAYGAVALVVDLLIKAAALSTLDGRARVIAIAAAAGAVSRGAPVALAAALPYARSSGGTGSSLTRGGRTRASCAAVVAVALAVGVARGTGAVCAGVAAAIVVLAIPLLRAWLSGVTGDTLGAAVEATETACLVAAVAFLA
jgi:adenosylcobinamide-GDP ribazoletransferase